MRLGEFRRRGFDDFRLRLGGRVVRHGLSYGVRRRFRRPLFGILPFDVARPGHRWHSRRAEAGAVDELPDNSGVHSLQGEVPPPGAMDFPARFEAILLLNALLEPRLERGQACGVVARCRGGRARATFVGEPVVKGLPRVGFFQPLPFPDLRYHHPPREECIRRDSRDE
jgi:hypothetical protein